MSQIYNALRKRNQEPEFDSSPNKGTVEEERIFHLPPLLIDESPDFFKEIASLSTNLFVLAKGNLSTIMLCGSGIGAGATMIAMNLASYIVRKEAIPTLLVEANIKRPTLYRYRNGYINDGLYELLAEQGPLNKYVLPTSTPNLFIMTAGRITSENMAFFKSSQIEYAISECKNNYPLVIFDAASIEDGHGTLEFAKFVDSVTMVVRANSLTEDVRKAQRALENVQAKFAGVIFNDH